jgi:hypothetical protein
MSLNIRRPGHPVVFALVLLAGTGCDNDTTLAPAGRPLETVAFAGGIPIGTFGQPNSEFGDRYNGAQRNILPADLLTALAAIQARGGKVVLSIAGGPNQYKDADGHFSFSLWQSRVNRYEGIDFSGYIADSTVMGHYLVDEPNDPNNWGGVPIHGETVEAMAQYSKQLWPDLPTVVRGEPTYLAQAGIAYHYLDAAWAQYVARKGAPADYLQRNVTDAQSLGLELVVGLNILAGGTGGVPLTAAQVRDWGTVLLSSSYPCAFLSWKYDATYLASAEMGSAMDDLRSQAQGRPTKSCRSGGASSPPPDPDPADVVITWAEPQDITYGTALGSGQLNATAASGGQSVAGTFTYQPAAGTVLDAGEDQELTATFTPSNAAAYESATASVRLDVLRAAPTLVWSVPASTTVGPLSAGLLTATASGAGGAAVPGTFTYSPAAGQFLDAAPTRTLSVTFQPSSANYTTATRSVSLAVLYPWSGFFEPTNNPQVLNRVKAGAAIPVRFSLGGNQPAPVLATGSPEITTVTCPKWTNDAIEETVSASTSSLQYESATGRYVYTWKTETTWTNRCRRFRLVLKDGTSREAIFRFIK